MTDVDLDAARAGDADAFARLVGGHRRELLAHCYRMLGSVADAEDAVQEALLAAWRGLGTFEGRSSLRTWLYRITTHVCLRHAARRPPRALSWEVGPPRSETHDLGAPVDAPFLEPWLGDGVEAPTSADDPEARAVQRERIELAYVAALTHLPPTQRAVLVLREVLALSAAEVADVLDTTPAAVNSALQRARASLADRVPAHAERGTRDLPPGGRDRDLLDRFVDAWHRADVGALVELLADDVRFTMPPLPAWFDGRDAVERFLVERVFATPWRLVPTTVNAQPGFAAYQDAGDGVFRLSSLTALTVGDGSVTWIASFLDPALHPHWGLPEEVAPADR